jgi:hypothetical protein
VYIAGGWLLPGRKRVVPYSIQWLKRLRPAWFRQDLLALFDLLQQQKIKPLIAQRLPLAEARHAHELLGQGGGDRQDRARAQRVSPCIRSGVIKVRADCHTVLCSLTMRLVQANGSRVEQHVAMSCARLCRLLQQIDATSSPLVLLTQNHVAGLTLYATAPPKILWLGSNSCM